MTEDSVNCFTRKLRGLARDETEKPILLELKSIVLNSDKDQLTKIVEECPLQPIFECMNSSDDEQIELSCTIIYHLLRSMSPRDCLKSYSSLIQRALSHPSSKIKCTFLSLLDDIVAIEGPQGMYRDHPTIVYQVAECLGSAERSVAQGSIRYFANCGKTADGLHVLYSRALLGKFREVMLVNDIARFRIYEVVSDVAQHSDEGLQASQASGLLNLLLSEVKSSDTLLQLNALEILSNLGSSRHGYKYLKDSGVIQYLADKILRLGDEPLSFVLLPGLIEFFGNICRRDPEEFIRSHGEVVDLLFHDLESTDEVLLGVIYSTVGKIGSTRRGKMALSRKKLQMGSLLSRAGELLRSKNDTTAGTLNSLAELFTVRNEEEEEEAAEAEEEQEGGGGGGGRGKEDMSKILLQWFGYLGPEALDAILTLAKLPFIELRLSALMFLNAIARQAWGAEKLCQYPGMIEYLTDRSTEFHKDCKIGKFEIVSSLVDSPNISALVSDDILTKLKDFVREGPFYVPTSPEMMTEGAS